MKDPTHADLLAENEELRVRLADAEEILRAIREGDIDAVIVSGSKGEQVFSLVGADSIYRLIVETMKEAAFTVTFDGKILFCNAQFGEFVKRPLETVVGHPLSDFVAENIRAATSALLAAAHQQPVRQRLVFQATDGTALPAHVAANVLNLPDGLNICVVANDLTELENSTELIQKLRRQEESLRKKTEELSRANKELSYFNSVMVGRELRMIQLKKEVDKLCRQFGQPLRYGYEVVADEVGHPLPSVPEPGQLTARSASATRGG